MVDSAPAQRTLSHFLTLLDGRKTYDIACFRAAYGHLLLTDGLVMGYYMHLLQDLVFRDYMYHTLRFNPRSPGYLTGLHSDYRRLNQLLIRHFDLHNDFNIAETAEPLEAIAAFDMSGLPSALTEDFTQPGAEEAFFFTMDMALHYIGRAVAKCREELHAMKQGMPLTDPKAWTWQTDPV